MTDFPSGFKAQGPHTPPENRLIIESAPVALAEVSAQRPLISQLWARRRCGSLRQSRVVFLDQRIVGNFGERGQRTDPESSIARPGDTP
jgi:hypothetical protein